MAHPNSLAAEIEAAEKEIYGNPSENPAAQAVSKKKEVLMTDGNGNPIGSLEAPEGTSPELEAPVTPPAEPAVPTEPAAQAPAPEGVVTPAEPATDWEKRYKNYKASSDATIHGLRTEVLGLRETVQKLDDENYNLKKQLEAAKQTPETALTFSPEEREVLGEDTVKALEKANAAAEAKLKPLRDKLQESEDARRKEKADRLKAERASAHEKFVGSVKVLVPNFEQIDRNPQFAEWMKGPDKASGHLRESLFRKAQAAGDVERVAGFFKQFEELFMKTRRTEESRVTPTSSPSSQNITRTSENNGTPVITQEFINKFYDDSARGRYRGRLKEQQEIERMIDNHLRALAQQG